MVELLRIRHGQTLGHFSNASFKVALVLSWLSGVGQMFASHTGLITRLLVQHHIQYVFDCPFISLGGTLLVSIKFRFYHTSTPETLSAISGQIFPPLH